MSDVPDIDADTWKLWLEEHGPNQQLVQWADLVHMHLGISPGDTARLHDVALQLAAFAIVVDPQRRIEPSLKPPRNPEEPDLPSGPYLAFHVSAPPTGLVSPLMMMQRMLDEIDAKFGIDVAPPRKHEVRFAYRQDVRVDVGRLLGRLLFRASHDERVRFFRGLGKSLRRFAPDVADYLESYGS